MPTASAAVTGEGRRALCVYYTRVRPARLRAPGRALSSLLPLWLQLRLISALAGLLL